MSAFRGRKKQMSVTSLEEFLDASLRRRLSGAPEVLSPLEQKTVDELAACMDLALQKMVHEMEAAARCQQPVEDKGPDQGIPSFEAFCHGVEKIADALLPELFHQFRTQCKSHKVSPAHLMWVMSVRADALSHYLVQLARVHGLAGTPQHAIGEPEREILAALERGLRRIIERESSLLTA